MVAGVGGGGGGGGDCSGSSGGAGGTSAATAGDGGNCSPGVEHGGTGGAVGTDSAGGTGGTGGADGTGTGTVGEDGDAGSQGAGGTSATIGSGGGGGGLWGGGGGGGGAISTVPHWGAGGGGGAGSSFATTDDGPTTDAAEVSITYDATPPPVGTSDLKIFLKHQGVLQHHRLGSYGIWVTNPGTAATTNSHPIVVTLDTGRGIMVAQGGRGTDWQCHKQDRATTCTRAAPLGAGKRTMITVSVWINARAGKTRHATATVSPSDTTAADNTSTDKAIIRKH